MNRKVVFLNVLLIALMASLGWMLRLRWTSDKAHERSVLSRAVAPRTVFATPAPAPPRPVTAADYIEVAQKTLFSKDRNPTVVIEAPPPKPEPVMPALPRFHGTIMLGDAVIILSLDTRDAAQKGYRVGESIGPFKILAFDRDNITLEWNGKKVERKVKDLAPVEPQPGQPGAPPVAAPAVQPNSSGSAPITPLGSNAAGDSSPKNPTVGTDVGGGFRACTAGDTSPSGTVVGGYKKVVVQGLMGSSCHWELAK